MYCTLFSYRLVLILIIYKVWQHQSFKGSTHNTKSQVLNTNEENDHNEKQLKLIKGRKGDIRNSLLILYYLRLYQVIPKCSINIPLKQQKESETRKQVANVAAAFTSGGCKALQYGPSLGRLKNLLLKAFMSVDLVSASRNVLETSRKSMGPDSWRVERIYNTRLEEFTPEPKRFYDVIWLQGVVTHLQDEDLVALLARLKSALTPVSKSESAQFTPSPSSKNGGSRKFSEHLLKLLPLERGGVVIVKVHVPRWISANATKHHAHKKEGSTHVIFRERAQLKELFARSGLKLLIEWKIDAKWHHKKQMPLWLFILR